MQNIRSDELHHSGRKGMRWGSHIFRRNTPSVKRIRRTRDIDSSLKKEKRPVDEEKRERNFINEYKYRDRMSTQVLKARVNRLEAEQKFKKLVEAPAKERAEKLQKRRQARLAFIGKVVSAGIDVYSKVPSNIAGKNKSGKAAESAIKAFKQRQEWAKAFKDVPTTMTKFDSGKK
nr:MAG TPA: Structural protein [Caudoviricetes sp.]